MKGVISTVVSAKERWAFEITDDAGRRVATVPFADLPKTTPTRRHDEAAN